MKSTKELVEINQQPIFYVNLDLSITKINACKPYLYGFYHSLSFNITIPPEAYESFDEWKNKNSLIYLCFSNEQAAKECIEFLSNERLGLLKEKLVGKTIKDLYPIKNEHGFKFVFEDGTTAEIFWPQ